MSVAVEPLHNLQDRGLGRQLLRAARTDVSSLAYVQAPWRCMTSDDRMVRPFSDNLT